jgi:hypothetical protein
VIDKEPPANARAGVNLDSGECSGKLADHPSGRVPAGIVKPVRHAMEQDCVKTGVAEHDFQDASRRGIATENGIDLFTDRPEHAAVIIAKKSSAGRPASELCW